MKIRTHMDIARLAIKNVKNRIKLNRFEKILFYVGTIEPDFSITQFIYPHFYIKSSEYIYLKIKNLQLNEKKGLISAFELGRVVHYLSDFCCYVHASGDIGNVTEHLLYERNINKYLKTNFNAIFEELICKTSSINKFDNSILSIKALIEEYKLARPCFFNDIEKSTEICTVLLDVLYNSNSVLYNKITTNEIKLAL